MAKHAIRDELSAVLAFVGFIWLVFIIEYIPGLQLENYGIVPRTTAGLIGIVAAPFLHANLGHIINNTIPLTVLLVLLAGSRAASWAIVLSIVLLSGALLWLFGRPAIHIGASSLIYGLVAYLFVSGIREQRIVPLAIAVLVGFLYGGTLASGILPRWGSYISWDGHLFGAVAGALVAYIMTREIDTSGTRPQTF
ncbi:MAG TPA: rhomboid family intramembrane serine protease [Lacipirellulaceae bacterium]|nr:rhomboid family intramembrane serine protease [Lacipirellulaceae bacterium]